jgi:acyl-CoA hydrolase
MRPREASRSSAFVDLREARERRSRIVFTVTPGNSVTTPRSDVMYVITEFGMVNLKGKCVAERAKAIIQLAHRFARGSNGKPTKTG